LKTIRRRKSILSFLLVAGICAGGGAFADGGVHYTDIALDPGASGLVYEHQPSPRWQISLALAQNPVITQEEALSAPLIPRGLPGVVIFDYDRDGDLDIYVTNSAGFANSLFQNQLVGSGNLAFVDVGAAAGVGAVDQDSTGACAGDIDNDGDQDLYVLAAGEPNRMFENRGDGSFQEITDASGLGAGPWSSITCSFGDINNDGLLDLVIANVFDLSTVFPIFIEAYSLNHHNQLFLNAGGNAFTDVSETSGIQILKGFNPEFGNVAGPSWSISIIDYDQDGDQDIITIDEQGEILPAKYGGVDRGYIHVFQNDGTAHFIDVNVEANTNHFGGWMGAAYGDFNCDGHLDFFGANFGDYGLTVGTPLPYELGDHTSRPYLGTADGTFIDIGVGDLVATPFGWGISPLDYDNDGDTDVVYQGGLFGLTTESSNPGTLLQNQDCSASFVWDKDALDPASKHVQRVVRGLAVGDLNLDGFVDIVSVAGLDIPDDAQMLPYTATYGSPFDFQGFFVVNLAPIPGTTNVTSVGPDYPNGSLSVEINSADNGNGWVSVQTVGTVGITDLGGVNRDGTGAIVGITPEGGKTVLRPIVAGSSHASQDSLAADFGVGQAGSAEIEVRWPNGVRNRLYGVKPGERIVFPEIPCDFRSEALSRGEYVRCVTQSLRQIQQAGVISQGAVGRFAFSAFKAYSEHH
jgi:hypothetical protein